ncbi:hypothetical protein F2Q68_00018940, partial [Brassica cretica]
LEILSKIRHPHLVLLLGACPERGCLVYEYMDNGSLDDRLMLVNDTPPIPWFERFRIALEVASALVFLHKSKPRPIIHRDLKPGNILLNQNFVSKLGDVGLSTMVNQDDAASKITVLKKTSPVGTLCYIDPEYQRTGLISPKSDVYSLGVVILQLITAKPAIGITHIVEEAIGDDVEFMGLLDVKAGAWPISETRELAALGLRCTEMRRRDRPDLKDEIIPALERLRKVVDKYQNSLSRTPSGPPSHFICPLLKGVMNQPCLASDGYTYDREAIEDWLREKDTSPMLNLPLPNKNLLANYSLYSAIMEWKKSNKLYFEIEKLRAELKHVQEMYAMAQTETVDASEELTELNQRRFKESEKLVELKEKEEVAKDTASKDKERYEEVKELMMKEALHRREAEIKAERNAKEKDKLQASLVSPGIQYQHYSWEEIAAATSDFSEDLKIGVGAYGTVYKCNLHHTTGAVKVLHAGETQLSKQFDQELEILSKIRHPHLVLLLGACPERGCLVYEYMENGSLDDRLMLVNNTPPIPWLERFRIALEVASALVFLHKCKPRPIIHRDLKPGNILLDHNFVSKLGDVGLSTMVNQDDAASKLTVFKKTSPVGTLCYIDPEYQRTGIISPKSDVYSLGVVILQLITAKPAIAITHMVEEAIGDDAKFMGLLDVKAGSWPIGETRELAALGLWCTEMRRRDRPDLKDQFIPALERLRKVVDKAQNSITRTPSGPPSHFICPLLKVPVTNLPLPNKNLLANYTLYSAIMEWKSNKQ